MGLQSAVVRRVKPLLSDEAWSRVTGLADRFGAWDPRPTARARRPDRPALDPPHTEPAKTLTDWAVEFGTDKWGRHRYTPHYQRHFDHLRDETFTLLEIGIGGYKAENTGGASLRMWKAHFPKAQIVGLDMEDKSFVDEPRIQTHQGSQTDAALLRQIVAQARNLQVVIDDGSHRSNHVLATFDILFPLLPLGGIYVIEDTQTSYWRRYGGSLDPTAPTSMNFAKQLLDDLNYEERTPKSHRASLTEKYVVAVHAYHNLVFIEKGLNEEGTFKRPA